MYKYLHCPHDSVDAKHGYLNAYYMYIELDTCMYSHKNCLIVLLSTGQCRYPESRQERGSRTLQWKSEHLPHSVHGGWHYCRRRGNRVCHDCRALHEPQIAESSSTIHDSLPPQPPAHQEVSLRHEDDRERQLCPTPTKH